MNWDQKFVTAFGRQPKWSDISNIQILKQMRILSIWLYLSILHWRTAQKTGTYT